MNGVPNPSFSKEGRWCSCVVDDIGKSVERFGARFVGFLNVAKVGNQILENLAPRYTWSGFVGENTIE